MSVVSVGRGSICDCSESNIGAPGLAKMLAGEKNLLIVVAIRVFRRTRSSRAVSKAVSPSTVSTSTRIRFVDCTSVGVSRLCTRNGIVAYSPGVMPATLVNKALKPITVRAGSGRGRLSRALLLTTCEVESL